ncbi:MAG: PKD domain-containing protein [Dehalococcoidia bacterium]
MRLSGGFGGALVGVAVLGALFGAGAAPPSAPVGPRLVAAAALQNAPAAAPTFADTGDILVGAATTFAADPAPGPTTYSWDFGDGTAATSGAVVQHTFQLVDDYTVRLTAADAQGMATTASKSVRVIPALGLFIGEPVLGQIVPASEFSAKLSLDASGPASVSIKIGGTYLYSDRFDYVGGVGAALFEVPVVSVVNEDDPDMDANLIQKPGATIPLLGNVKVTVSYPVSGGSTESVSYLTSLGKPAAVAPPAPASATPSPSPSPVSTSGAAGSAQSPTPTPVAAAARYLAATPTLAPSSTSVRASTPAATPSPIASATPVAPPSPPVWQITYPSYLSVVGYPVNADDVNQYYIKGDPEFHAVDDPLLRRYAIKIARNGGIFPNDPQRAADNIYRYVYGLLGIGDPGELQTDVVLLSRVVSGALVSGARSGVYICIAHAYFVSSLTRTLGLPTREETIGFGRGVSQDASGAWKLNFYQEGANEVWYAGAWHHYDTWIGTRNRDDYLDTSLTEIAWYAFSEQKTPFMDVNGGPVGLAGHDFALGKYVGSPGSPDQWRFLEQHTRPGIRIADPGPEAYASADRAAAAAPGDLVSAGILNPPPTPVAGQ